MCSSGCSFFQSSCSCFMEATPSLFLKLSFLPVFIRPSNPNSPMAEKPSGDVPWAPREPRVGPHSPEPLPARRGPSESARLRAAAQVSCWSPFLWFSAGSLPSGDPEGGQHVFTATGLAQGRRHGPRSWQDTLGHTRAEVFCSRPAIPAAAFAL